MFLYPSLLLVFFCSCFSSVSCSSWAPSSQCPYVSDFAPSAYKAFGVDTTATTTATTSRYYITNNGRVGEAVRFVDTKAQSSSPSASLTVYIPLTIGIAPAITCQLINITDNFNNVVGSVLFNPLYGKSLAVSGALAAIGIPNRQLALTPSSSSLYLSASRIDIYTLPNSVSFSSLIDYTTPLLGLLLSLDSSFGVLISSYSSSQLAVYSLPLTGRRSSVHNSAAIGGGGGDSDYFLNLPLYFSPDSFALRMPQFAVTGISYIPSIGICVPALVTYVFTLSPPSWSSPSFLYLVPGSASVSPSLSSYSLFAAARVPCRGASVTPPQNLFSVDIQQLNSNTLTLAIGQPNINCLFFSSMQSNQFNSISINQMRSICENNYTLSTTSTNAGLHTWSNTINNFALSIGFASSSSASRLWVTSSSFISLFDLGIANVSFNSYIDRYPNRLYQTSIPSVTRIFKQIAVSSSFILILQDINDQLPGTEIVYMPIVPAGFKYSPPSQSYEECPLGRYKPSASIGPCMLCPAGTFANTTGATNCLPCLPTQYCPVGSTNNQITLSQVYPTEATVAEFEADEYQEVFEALIVLAVFGGFSSRTMVVFVVFSCFVSALSIIHVCTKGQVSEIVIVPLKALAVFHEGLDADIEKFEEEQEVSEGGVQDHHKHMHHDPETKWWKREYGIAHIFEGYVTAVFFIFGIGAMAFIFEYLTTYEPLNYGLNTEEQNIYRQQLTDFVGIDEPEAAASLAQLSISSFTLSVSLIGFSHPSVCTPSLITPNSMTFSGCIMPAGMTGSCVSNFTVALDPNDPNKNACLIQVTVPMGTDLEPSSSFVFAMSSLYTFSALVFSYSQPSSPISLPYEKMQTTAQSNTASVASQYEEKIIPFSPADVAASNNADLNIHLAFLITPLAVRTQNTDEWGPIFTTVWSRSLSYFSSPYLATESSSSFIYSSSSISSDYSISIDLTSNYYYTTQQTNRLVSKSQVILAMALGILGIFHMIHFGETILEFFFYHTMSLCCKKFTTPSSSTTVHKIEMTRGKSNGTGHGHGHGGAKYDVENH